MTATKFKAGPDNPNAKMTAAQVEVARNARDNALARGKTKWGAGALAKEWGVSRIAVERAARSESYKPE